MKVKLAVASWVVAVVLSVTALLLPPMGIIDHSVLLLVAQFLLVCATFLGVKGLDKGLMGGERKPLEEGRGS